MYRIHIVQQRGEPVTQNRNAPDTTGDEIKPAEAVKVGVNAGLFVVGLALAFTLTGPIQNNISIFQDASDFVVRVVFSIAWAVVVSWPIAYTLDRVVKRRAAL
ncbi:hypothetical protein [Streptomyces sp. NPDC055287]